MKRKFKLLIGICVLLLVVVAGVGFFVFKNISGSGSGMLEQWIGSELQTIANGYLNPKLSFSDLDYQYPGTVSLKNLKLTADDPANPGKAVDILGCDKAVLTLAEIPSVGKPIIIEKIVLDQPLFAAIAVEPKSAKFVGFSNLIKKTTSADNSPSTEPAPQASAPAPANRPKLSDVFRMRLIQIKDGKIVYNPRIPGTDAMTLDQINTKLDITPTDPGWYKVATAIARKPIFNLDVAGQVNLDTFSARDMAIKANADLNQDKLDFLPPQLQAMLKQYEVKGSLNAQVIAENIQVTDPMKGQLTADVKLNQANVTLGEFKIPIDSLDLSARMEDGKATLPKFTINALKGTADITGSATLNDKIDGDLQLKVAGMMLQQLLAGQKEGEPMKLAGKLNANVQVNAPLMVVVAKAKGPSHEPDSKLAPFLNEPLPDKWGSGTVSLTEGKLIRLPMVSGLTDAIGTASKLLTANMFEGSTTPTEKFDMSVDFGKDQMNVRDFNYVGDAVAARGKGTVTLDRKIDMHVNGGPVEKVQALLGKEIGGAIGAVTDSLLSYHVTGEIGHPQVSPEIGGGSVVDSTKKAAEGIGSGVEKVGEGIGKGLDSIFKKDGQK